MFANTIKQAMKNSSNKICIWGLSISFIGAIITAVSFAPGDGRQTSRILGIDYHLAIMNDYSFKIGLYLLILGFSFQVFGKSSFKKISIIIIFSFVLYWLFIYLSKFLFL